ncbi:hypothetical protein [Pelomonas sp. KK5]|uniref:hypothetical protein n=1 Tax=Pelomonas sp. KK5 TaxID=1855730 RepID=UPI00097CB4E7|nr:hypothetical protein [Pelomonas sp. KK5]
MMNKHLSTAAAAVALVSAIGLAYAQTSDQPADTSTTATAQQSDATDAVNRGTTATPDWRSPDNMSAQQATDANATPGDNTQATTAPADTSNSTATDNGMSSTAQQDNSATTSTDTTATAPSAPATEPSPMTTERAPRADRN